MKKLFLIAGCLLSLSACAVHTPEGRSVIDPDSRIYGHPGDFCPPGQAKKGRC
ncbi:hypothetical protein [Acinetobacter indicus]|uniref:hypothetical protein n=1 Tax=Acinetobacter indicus TaxID=756892 RepID=UPI002E37CD1F|nr:hypothetical protein [Acinetobacter indicus]